MKISRYIRQAYPFYYEDLKKVFLMLCCLAIVSLLFSYLFEPFTVNEAEHKIESIWILVIHAVLPIPIAMVYFVYLKKAITNTESWTLGKEFFHLALILLLIGIGNFLLRDFVYTNPDNWSLRYLWEEIRNTFLVGTLLLVVVLPLNLERLLHNHLKFLEKLPTNSTNEGKADSIQIKTPIAAEQFEIDLETFLFARVESNYLEVFCSSPNGFDKYLKRMTLKEFDDQLKSFPFLLKVHRSYLVNLQTIESISGNAQGYTLRLKDYAEGTVPVSRSMIQEFNLLYTNYRS